MKHIPLIIIAAAMLPLHAGLIPLGEHVDIRWRWESPGAWICQTVTSDHGGTPHAPEDVFLPLADKPYAAGNPANSGARFTQPASASFAFTGVPAGGPLWIAVQGTPGIGEAWPGFENNQSAGTFGSYIPNDPRVSQSSARAWIKVSLVDYQPPSGTNAHFSLWNTSTGSPPTIWMSTYDPSVSNEYHFAEGSHNHLNWGFSEPGLHRIQLKASAFAGPGESNPTGDSATYTFTFAIGPLARWQAEHFSGPQLDDPAISGPDADPDRDGMANLTEFAFGYDPNDGAATPVSTGLGLPNISLVEENGRYYEELRYPRRRAGEQVAPLIYSPQFSEDPANWVENDVSTTATSFPVEMDDLNAVWEQAVSRRPVGSGVPTRGFARIALTPGE